MLPIVVIVGRPNVGKSSLFNALTRTRNALVADFPGLTRDRQYGRWRVGLRSCWVVDTGGYAGEGDQGYNDKQIAIQTLQAITEADVVLFMTDVREGITAADRQLAAMLRKSGRPVCLVANKGEGRDPLVAGAEFHELAFGTPLVIAAAHNQGISDLTEEVVRYFPASEPEEVEDRLPRLAIIGRPNVGKSTLVNALLSEERMVVWDQPGTTRDAIMTPLEYDGRSYHIVDTAGLRRKGRVEPGVEKLSALKTLEAIERSQVVVVVVDSTSEVSEQDLQLIHLAVEAGRAIVVAMNKWDLLSQDEKKERKADVTRRLRFVSFITPVFISARRGLGLKKMMMEVATAHESGGVNMSTPQLTRTLRAAVVQQEPPRRGLVQPKLRYAHQGGVRPPVVVIHGNALNLLPISYHRYLMGVFFQKFHLRGTPLRLEFKNSKNPYKPTKNVARRIQ